MSQQPMVACKQERIYKMSEKIITNRHRRIKLSKYLIENDNDDTDRADGSTLPQNSFGLIEFLEKDLIAGWDVDTIFDIYIEQYVVDKDDDIVREFINAKYNIYPAMNFESAKKYWWQVQIELSEIKGVFERIPVTSLRMPYLNYLCMQRWRKILDRDYWEAREALYYLSYGPWEDGWPLFAFQSLPESFHRFFEQRKSPAEIIRWAMDQENLNVLVELKRWVEAKYP
jgi:hypothetical protein